MNFEKSLKEFADTCKFSGTALVAVENKSIFSESFGFSDHANQVKCSANTQYLIASVTKQFTAAALLKVFYDEVSSEKLRLFCVSSWYRSERV